MSIRATHLILALSASTTLAVAPAHAQQAPAAAPYAVPAQPPATAPPPEYPPPPEKPKTERYSKGMMVTGIVLTKLDGTARGGVILGIADQLKIPVRYIGIGEGVEDLRDFDAEEFVHALFPESTPSESPGGQA